MQHPYGLISTHHLDLYCLTVDELLELGEGKDPFGSRPFKNPYGVLTKENLHMANRIKDVRENPSHIRWYYRVIVDRESNIVVGSTSFHAAPDERGMIEIGVGIAPEEQGKGFASEAISGMWTWASTEPSVKFLRYSVSPNNVASMKIIENFDFPKVGEQHDEVDGLEYIFESSVKDYLDWV